MPKIVLQATSTAEWKELITEAQAQCMLELDENLESYLVFLLMRFTSEPHIAESLLALDYLSSNQQVGNNRRDGLQAVGDKCLLMAGLFPGNARRRLVEPSYFVRIGISAYHELSELERKSFAELYEHLAARFTNLMEVLQATRIVSGADDDSLDSLASYDIWQMTGSDTAKTRLQQQTTTDSEIIAPQIWDHKLH